jgi:polyferredoxin
MGGVSLFWVLFFTAATYINAGWLREAVCMHMCPMRGSRA